MIKIVKIAGLSMSPGLMPGDFVIALRWPTFLYRRGQRVLVEHPSLGLIVKRLENLEGNTIWLSGDSALSSSREAMGCQPRSVLSGFVVWTVRRSAGK